MGKDKYYEDLHMAAMLGETSELAKLLQAGADPNQIGSHGADVNRVQ